VRTGLQAAPNSRTLPQFPFPKKGTATAAYGPWLKHLWPTGGSFTWVLRPWPLLAARHPQCKPLPSQWDSLAARPLAEQFDLSRAAVEGLHPSHGRELEKPMAIAWSKVPCSLGIGARYASDRDPDYAVLSEPDGPFYFAGEHLSHVGQWQEGAILAARRAINMMDKHRRVRLG